MLPPLKRAHCQGPRVLLLIAVVGFFFSDLFRRLEKHRLSGVELQLPLQLGGFKKKKSL